MNVNAPVYYLDCSNKDRGWRTVNSQSDLSGIYRRVWPTDYFRARRETDGRAVIDVAVHLAAVSDPGESCASYCGPVSTRLTALQHGRGPLILFTPSSSHRTYILSRSKASSQVIVSTVLCVCGTNASKCYNVFFLYHHHKLLDSGLGKCNICLLLMWS